LLSARSMLQGYVQGLSVKALFRRLKTCVSSRWQLLAFWLFGFSLLSKMFLSLL
jgi:hypothetical protein